MATGLTLRKRASARARYVAAKGWLIAQAALAAGVAFWIAGDVLGHAEPFVAPLAAVVSLGTTYGQRITRVAEVTVGIALGLLLADALVHLWGRGVVQLVLVVALAILIALALGAGPLLVSQAAVQAIVFVSAGASDGQTLERCSDALIGGAVAILAATVVPRAALRHPHVQAAGLADAVSELLHEAAAAMRQPDVESTLILLKDARSTDPALTDLRLAASEGLSAMRGSPFRRRERQEMLRMSEIVEPLDHALRNTRVLIRRLAVAAMKGEPISAACADSCDRVGEAVQEIARTLEAREDAAPLRSRLVQLGSEAWPSSASDAEVVVAAQLRSVVADLLRLSGLDPIASTRALISADF
jgi:uncharacterized membrane protein YgaE (UPF0421/DUF939 family)